MKLHASGEDYLEAILVLHKKMGRVRSVDVARHMEVRSYELATPYAFPSGHSMSGWSHSTYDLERKYRYGFDYQTQKELFHRLQLYG